MSQISGFELALPQDLSNVIEACAYFPGNYPRPQGRLRANGILTSSAYQIQERNSMQAITR